MREDDVRALVQYRLEQAQTALDDAAFLLNGRRSPQSVINRAYYAMYYAAIALLQSVGEVTRRHTGAVSLFDTEFVHNGVFPKELSRSFHKAFELRQLHDYRATQPASRGKASEALENAIEFVDAVRKHLTA